ncbi:MAG: TolB family protein [Planctomycetes bacterium]|nr:TolB family protein [Planctomycetota bacterium]
MIRAISALLTACMAAGCGSAYYGLPAAGPSRAIRVETITRPDREMQELMAVMGRLAPPAGAVDATAVSPLRQHSFQTIGGDTDPCVDPSGRYMVYASTAHSPWPDIYIKQIDGKAVTQLTNDPASDIQPAISPDGRCVAFASNRTGAYEIYVMTLDGKAIRQVTSGGGDNVHPSWSPDGTRLIYACQSVRSGQWEMWITSPTRPGSRQFVGNGLFPVWSPTADRIAFQRPRARDGQLYGIWMIELANDEPSLPTLVADAPDRAFLSPSFSADGRRLAFASVAPQGVGQVDIYTVDLDGRNLQQLTRGPGRKYGPTWVGESIYFSCDRDGQENIWSVRTEGHAPSALTGGDAGDDYRTVGVR